MDNNVSIPFDENQTSSVKKSALKGATLHSDGSFPVKAKGAGAPVKKLVLFFILINIIYTWSHLILKQEKKSPW